MKLKICRNLIYFSSVLLLVLSCGKVENKHELFQKDLDEKEIFSEEELVKFKNLINKYWWFGIANGKLSRRNSKTKKRVQEEITACTVVKADSVLILRLYRGNSIHLEGNIILFRVCNGNVESAIRYYSDHDVMPQSYHPSTTIYSEIVLDKKEYEVGDTIIGTFQIKAEKIVENMKLVDMKPHFKKRKVEDQEAYGSFMSIVRKVKFDEYRKF